VKVLLDQNINPRLRRFLTGHFFVHAQRVGWDRLENGHLIRAAERNQYDVLITGDKRMHSQQNNATRQLSIVLLEDVLWSGIQAANEEILSAVETSTPGSYLMVPRSKPNHD
jgi:predicted nuclease of predicted toxin-antitoxin system